MIFKVSSSGQLCKRVFHFQFALVYLQIYFKIDYSGFKETCPPRTLSQFKTLLSVMESNLPTEQRTGQVLIPIFVYLRIPVWSYSYFRIKALMQGLK